eukprot:jgi/Astpho2/5030/gw1.00071.42.1_t
MPLTPVHVWEETPRAITITVQLPGVLKRNAIVTSGDLLLTINASPYVLHLDLYKEVDQAQSSILTDTTIRMLQAKEGTWGKLLFEGSKQEVQSRRQASLARLHKLADQEREDSIKLKHKLQSAEAQHAAPLRGRQEAVKIQFSKLEGHPTLPAREHREEEIRALKSVSSCAWGTPSWLSAREHRREEDISALEFGVSGV